MKHEPASTVLDALGVRPLARALGVSAGYVGQWQMSKACKGTDGRIPPSMREAVLEFAREKNVTIVTKELVYMEPKKKSGGRYAREKGARHERHVVKLLKDADIDAHKVPLSGAVEGYPGDVLIEHPSLGRIIVQCKNGKQGRAYSGINAALGIWDCIHVTGKTGTEMIGMPWDEFIRFLHGEHQSPLQVERIRCTNKMLDDAIAGHDVLIYKPDRQPDRVLILLEKYREWCQVLEGKPTLL